eukprot:PRCOL_00001945-RA
MTLWRRPLKDAWNSRDPSAVARAYTPDTQWRNRSEFLRGRDEVEAFLRRKWAAEHEYKLIKQLWAHSGDRIAVTFQYEYRSAADGQYWRAYGNELWEFAKNGLMQRRVASINDVGPISKEHRRFTWEGQRRPDDFPGLHKWEHED